MNAPPTTIIAAGQDSVGIALCALEAGAIVDGVTITEAIPAGHKLAKANHNLGDPVIKFGQPIGVASASILPGQHVHVHNVRFVAAETPPAIGSRLVEPEPRSASFMGYIATFLLPCGASRSSRTFCSVYKTLIFGDILVAGAGFEPATFRL
jgi:altronate hydrolase